MLDTSGFCQIKIKEIYLYLLKKIFKCFFHVVKKISEKISHEQLREEFTLRQGRVFEKPDLNHRCFLACRSNPAQTFARSVNQIDAQTENEHPEQ